MIDFDIDTITWLVGKIGLIYHPLTGLKSAYDLHKDIKNRRPLKQIEELAAKLEGDDAPKRKAVLGAFIEILKALFSCGTSNILSTIFSSHAPGYVGFVSNLINIAANAIKSNITLRWSMLSCLPDITRKCHAFFSLLLISEEGSIAEKSVIGLVSSIFGALLYDTVSIFLRTGVGIQEKIVSEFKRYVTAVKTAITTYVEDTAINTKKLGLVDLVVTGQKIAVDLSSYDIIKQDLFDTIDSVLWPVLKELNKSVLDVFSNTVNIALEIQGYHLTDLKIEDEEIPLPVIDYDYQDVPQDAAFTKLPLSKGITRTNFGITFDQPPKKRIREDDEEDQENEGTTLPINHYQDVPQVAFTKLPLSRGITRTDSGITFDQPIIKKKARNRVNLNKLIEDREQAEKKAEQEAEQAEQAKLLKVTNESARLVTDLLAASKETGWFSALSWNAQTALKKLNEFATDVCTSEADQQRCINAFKNPTADNEAYRRVLLTRHSPNVIAQRELQAWSNLSAYEQTDFNNTQNFKADLLGANSRFVNNIKIFTPQSILSGEHNANSDLGISGTQTATIAAGTAIFAALALYTIKKITKKRKTK